MNLKTVCVDHPGVTAHRGKIKSGFSVLHEVLRLAPATVKPNNLIRFCLHRGDDKGIQVDHLSIGLLDLEDYPPRIRPAAGLILELSVFHRVIDLVLARGAVKSFVHISRIFDQRLILLQTDRILAVVFSQALYRSGDANPLSPRR